MCTIGPSLPKQRPADTDSISPTDLTSNVHLPKYPRIMNPDRMVLISGIPEPHAYGANIRTSDALSRAKPNAHSVYKKNEMI